MKKIPKYFKPIVLIGILLLSIGCTGNSTEESDSVQNIRTILQEEFNGPSKELGELLYHGLNSEKFEKLGQYYVENYKPHLSERFFENYVINTASASMFLRMAYPDYNLKAEEIKVEEKENYYKFTVKVSYTNNRSNESKTMNIKGHAQTNEEDKVTSIQFINPEELRSALK